MCVCTADGARTAEQTARTNLIWHSEWRSIKRVSVVQTSKPAAFVAKGYQNMKYEVRVCVFVCVRLNGFLCVVLSRVDVLVSVCVYASTKRAPCILTYLCSGCGNLL